MPWLTRVSSEDRILVLDDHTLLGLDEAQELSHAPLLTTCRTHNPRRAGAAGSGAAAVARGGGGEQSTRLARVVGR